MTFEEKFNLDKDLPHNELYTAIVNNLGYDAVKQLIPFSLDEIVKALKTDKHLNNLPLETWNNATGYKVEIDFCSRRQIVKLNVSYKKNSAQYHSLAELCFSNGVTTFCLAELVCILKRCAVMWAEAAE